MPYLDLATTSYPKLLDAFEEAFKKERNVNFNCINYCRRCTEGGDAGAISLGFKRVGLAMQPKTATLEPKEGFQVQLNFA